MAVIAGCPGIVRCALSIVRRRHSAIIYGASVAAKPMSTNRPARCRTCRQTRPVAQPAGERTDGCGGSCSATATHISHPSTPRPLIDWWAVVEFENLKES